MLLVSFNNNMAYLLGDPSVNKGCLDILSVDIPNKFMIRELYVVS